MSREEKALAFLAEKIYNRSEAGEKNLVDYYIVVRNLLWASISNRLPLKRAGLRKGYKIVSISKPDPVETLLMDIIMKL
jgi:hypothetical protein